MFMTTASQRGGPRRTGKRYGPNRRPYVHLCDHCGELFQSSRPDARYCTASHRAAANKVKAEQAAEQSRRAREERAARRREAKKKRNKGKGKK